MPAPEGRIVQPEGRITRGTTGLNRLRRSDRWSAQSPAVIAALAGPSPLAVDVGYGARPNTTLEWASWLRRVAPSVQVTGLEIDPDRVVPDRDGVHFARGGFELAGLRPNLVRAFNVLRQYDESEVADAWATVTSRLAPGGVFIRAPATSWAGGAAGSRWTAAGRGPSRWPGTPGTATTRRTWPSGCRRR